MLAFLLSAVGVSLSGVMAPGSITAATLAAGTRSRHAGSLIALGHAVIEFPLILLIAGGFSVVLNMPAVVAVIGLAGGCFLLWSGGQLLRSAPQAVSGAGARPADARSPFLTGIALTGGNPYFLIWWATMGLTLTTRALEFGLLVLVLFAVIHWLCDLVWLEILSQASFRGARWLGGRSEQVLARTCGVAMLGLGGWFILSSAAPLWK